MGNITEIRDDAQQTIYFANTVVTPNQAFTYDALYRLITAEGREKKGLAAFGASDNTDDSNWTGPHKGDGCLVHQYVQHYTYDAVGNIQELNHVVPSATSYSFTRTYTYAGGSNRLATTGVATETYSYDHDARGNFKEMPHLSLLQWNIANELNKIVSADLTAYYQYSGGQRIRKWVDKGSIKEERIYLGAYEIYRKFESGSLTSPVIERSTVHISDDTGRIAMLERRTIGDK